MQAALPVNQIENPASQTNSRTGDGSFTLELQKAEANLKNKNLSLFPWDQLQNMFGILPLNFDFNGTNFEPEADKQNTEEKNVKKIDDASNGRLSQNTPHEKDPVVMSDVKAIKEALIKLVPNPVVPPPFMPYALNPSASAKTVSKADLQILIDEIVENAKLLKTQKKVELSLLLFEKNLGEMSLTLSSRNGLISIQIGACDEIRKNLEKNILDLESALKSANIDVDQLKIVEVRNGQLFPNG